MRYNENEVIGALAFATPDWEGKLTYKSPKSGGGFTSRGNDFKERYFRLKANFLFYWRVQPNGLPPAKGAEPLGTIVLEGSHVQQEGFAQSIHAFSLIFADEPEKKHMFLADTQRHVAQWISALKKARYEDLRSRLIELQIKLVNRTGRDPLVGTMLESSPIYCRRPSAHVVAPNFCSGEETSSPRAKPRKSKKSTFQSHVVERWEGEKEGEEKEGGGKLYFPPAVERKASFQSHIEVPEGNLLDLAPT